MGEREALLEYLLSDEYAWLLYRAIAARLVTTQTHRAEHTKALELFRNAFPGATFI